MNEAALERLVLRDAQNTAAKLLTDVAQRDDVPRDLKLLGAVGAAFTSGLEFGLALAAARPSAAPIIAEWFQRVVLHGDLAALAERDQYVAMYLEAIDS